MKDKPQCLEEGTLQDTMVQAGMKEETLLG